MLVTSLRSCCLSSPLKSDEDVRIGDASEACSIAEAFELFDLDAVEPSLGVSVEVGEALRLVEQPRPSISGEVSFR